MNVRTTPRTIRGKAVLGAGLAIAIFGLIIGAVTYVVVTTAALTSTTATLEAQVGEIVDQLTEQAAGNPAAVDLEVLPASNPTSIQLQASDGAILAASGVLASSDRICPQPVPTAPQTDRVILSLDGAPTGLVRHAAPVLTPRGSLTVCAVTSDQAIEKAQEAVLLTLLIALPLLVIGVGVVVWFAVGRALRAVDDLTSQADRMQSTADGQLRVAATRDEIEHLGHTLNALLDRLHQQTRATRQFVADAGHELRNPISALRVTLEFSQDAEEADVRASVGDALGDVDRLEDLVEDLLVLARTDAVEAKSDHERVDLAALLTDVADSAARSAPGLSIQLETESCEIRGNRRALRSLVTNLIDNATRHAHARVNATLTTTGDTVLLRVDDDGDGLRAEDCTRVFDRFVRLDEARDRDEGGSGLGLAIVAAVAHAHGGTAAAEPGPGGHFVVTMRR